jgi:phosphopantetheinyl transferase
MDWPQLNNMSTEKQQSNSIKEAVLKNYGGLYSALKRVHIRLVHEGYRFEKGRILPPLIRSTFVIITKSLTYHVKQG